MLPIRIAFVWCYLNDRYAEAFGYPLTMWTLIRPHRHMA
jgi:hypothetical protein